VSVEIFRSRSAPWVPGNESYRLPRSAGAPPQNVDPDPDAYASAAWLPRRASRCGHDRVHPRLSDPGPAGRARALPPASGEIRIADRFRVQVVTEPASGAPPVRRPARIPIEKARDEIAARVDWALPATGDAAMRSPSNAGPSPIAARGFRPTERPSADGSAVEMVIVTDPLFAAGFQELADWRTKTGLPTVVRTTQWILANYEAPDLSAGIREFLRDAHLQWGADSRSWRGHRVRSRPLCPLRARQSSPRHRRGHRLLLCLSRR